jgi:hypothetical protein
MVLYKKTENNEYITIDVQTLGIVNNKNSVVVFTVGNEDYYPSQKDMEEIKSFVDQESVFKSSEVLILPFYVKITDITLDSDKNYLLVVNIPFHFSKADEVKVEKEITESLQSHSNIKVKVLREDLNITVQEASLKSKFPPLTQQMVEHIDGTPTLDYAIRILKVYRENCNCKWSDSLNEENKSRLFDIMNEAQDKRAELLDKAISALEEHLK